MWPSVARSPRQRALAAATTSANARAARVRSSLLLRQPRGLITGLQRAGPPPGSATT